MRPIRVRRLIVIALSLWLGGCASADTSVDVDVNRSLTRIQVTTYSIAEENLPGFLVPYFRDELAVALADRGAKEIADGADVAFILRFDRASLTDEPPRRDDFGGTMERFEEASFLARVTLFARAAGAADEVRVGTLARAHAVSAGQYMHERSRADIRRGLERLLDGFLTDTR